MKRFEIGDQVVVTRETALLHGVPFGTEALVVELALDQNHCRIKYGPLRQVIHMSDLDPAPVPEHPALTLAKAKVAQLTAIKDRNALSECGHHGLRIHLEYLRAFGLEYRAKPVVPQPVEYEFVPVQEPRA